MNQPPTAAAATGAGANRVPLARSWGSAVGLVAALGVLGAAWAVLQISPGRLSAPEREIFVALNSGPDLLSTLVGPIMVLGTVAAVPAIAMGAWWRWNRPAPALTVAVAGVAAWLLAKAGKLVVSRGRPSAFLDARVHETGLSGYGFPSGHSAVAFALATALAPWLGRRGRVVGYTLAGGVALARLVVGAHLPLDVVGGAALGVAAGLVARLIVGVPVRGGDPDDPSLTSPGPDADLAPPSADG